MWPFKMDLPVVSSSSASSLSGGSVWSAQHTLRCLKCIFDVGDVDVDVASFQDVVFSLYSFLVKCVWIASGVDGYCRLSSNFWTSGGVASCWRWSGTCGPVSWVLQSLTPNSGPNLVLGQGAPIDLRAWDGLLEFWTSYRKVPFKIALAC